MPKSSLRIVIEAALCNLNSEISIFFNGEGLGLFYRLQGLSGRKWPRGTCSPAPTWEGAMQAPQQISIGNRLLASLSSKDFATLQPHLEPVPLPVRQVLIEPNTPIAHIYFPEAGMASVTNNSGDGKIEVGVIGWEGMVGLPVVLG